MLTVVRGAADVARARRSQNSGRSSHRAKLTDSKEGTFYNSDRSSSSLSRVRGRVRVAVDRERDKGDSPEAPSISQRKGSSLTHGIYASEREEEEFWPIEVTKGQTKTSSQQQSPLPQQPPPHTQYPIAKQSTLTRSCSSGNRSIPQEEGYSSTEEDITTDGTIFGSTAPTEAFGHRDAAITTKNDVEQHSLVSWLLPSSDRTQERRRQKAPTQGDSDALEFIDGSTTRTWSAFPQARGSKTTVTRNNSGGKRGGSLSAWLEPREPSRSRKRTKLAGGVRTGTIGCESESSEPPEEEDGDSSKWMSERLGGLDPGGAARAKESWSDRERRNLTPTDVALRGKRKAKGVRGWRTEAGSSKVFVAPVRGGAAVVSSGQAASRMSMGSRRKKSNG